MLPDRGGAYPACGGTPFPAPRPRPRARRSRAASGPCRGTSARRPPRSTRGRGSTSAAPPPPMPHHIRVAQHRERRHLRLPTLEARPAARRHLHRHRRAPRARYVVPDAAADPPLEVPRRRKSASPPRRPPPPRGGPPWAPGAGCPVMACATRRRSLRRWRPPRRACPAGTAHPSSSHRRSRSTLGVGRAGWVEGARAHHRAEQRGLRRAGGAARATSP